MKCPVCEIEFRGNQFYRTGERGRFRECPNGHDFKEPPRPKPNFKAQRDELAEALRAVLVMWDYGPQPRKLDEALSWRDNDTKVRAMADAALAKCND